MLGIVFFVVNFSLESFLKSDDFPLEFRIDVFAIEEDGVLDLEL